MRQDNQSRLSRWRVQLRQRRQHRAFRIAEPRWDEMTRLRGLAEQLSTALLLAEERPAEPSSGQDGAELIKAANNLWLVRKKYQRIGDPKSRDYRQINRYLQALEDALKEVGVTFHDHDGQEYDAGFPLEVIDFVPDPELRVETVQRTLRPSVSLYRKLIQKGQVIVGCPTDDPMGD